MSMTIKSVVQSVANLAKGSAVYQLFLELNAIRSNRVLRAPGMRIKGGATSAIVQNQNTFEALVGGVLVRKAQSDMPALVGTVLTTQFGVWLFFMDNAGTTTISAMATAATLALIALPTVPLGVTLIGALLVNPTGTGSFVGGTTQLDDGTVVPNAVFYDGHSIGALGDQIKFKSAAGLPA